MSDAELEASLRELRELVPSIKPTQSQPLFGRKAA